MGNALARSLRWLVPPAAATLLAAACLAPQAQASRSQRVIFDASNEFLRAHGPGIQPTLDEIDAFGVDTVRLLVFWNYLAPAAGSSSRPPGNPADPAFYPADRWSLIDSIVQGANARGMSVLLTPTGPFPRWASQSRNSSTLNPRPAEFGDFVRAIGQRYRGGFDPDGLGLQPALPRVRFFAIYNEPNVRSFLGPLGRAPAIYRQLYVQAKRALNATGHGSDTVLIGETSPKGGGGRSTSPLSFARELFCLKPRRRCPRLDADGYGIHPYEFRTPPWIPPRGRNDVNVGSLRRLTRVLDQAARAGRIRRRIPLYLTEYGIQSFPDRFSGVSLAKQAEFRSIAEYIAWRNGRVRGFSQYLMRDDSPTASGSRFGGFETGLRRSAAAGGAAKPSYNEFRTPLVVKRRRGRVLIWGHVRPGGRASVEIEARDGGRAPRRLKRLRTNGRGYFSIRSRYRGGRRWRLRALQPSLPPGPFVRAYSF